MEENAVEEVQSEAPRSTEAIAEQVVSESAETSSESAAKTTEPVPTQEELSGAAKFIVSKNHKWGKRENGADLSYLPASTAARMMEEYAEQQRELWAAEHHAPTKRELEQAKADLQE